MKKALQLCIAALFFFAFSSRVNAESTCELSTTTDPNDATKIVISVSVNFENLLEKALINGSEFVQATYDFSLEEGNTQSRPVYFFRCSSQSDSCNYQASIELASVGASPPASEKTVSNVIAFNHENVGTIRCASALTLKPASEPDEEPAGGGPGGGGPGGGGAGGVDENAGNGGGGFEGGFTSVTDDVLDSFNPLKVTESEYAEEFSTPGGILSRFLNVFAFPLAGLILFVMIIWGGFEMVAGATNKKSLDAGRQRITAALIGFILLFASYWIARVLEVALGVNIL